MLEPCRWNVIDAGRMRDNLDATRGLIFADAAAAILSADLGREAAHRTVSEAAAIVHGR